MLVRIEAVVNARGFTYREKDWKDEKVYHNNLLSNQFNVRDQTGRYQRTMIITLSGNHISQTLNAFFFVFQ